MEAGNKPKSKSWFALVGVCLMLAAIFLGPRLIHGIPTDKDLRALWKDPYFSVGNLSISPELLIEILVYILLLTVATRFSRRFLRREILSRTMLDQGQQYAIERTFGYAVYALGLFVGVQIVGLNLSSLAFLGGAVGIGVGFGLQNIASNFASGLILLLERPIKVGDWIEVGGLNGAVVRIGGRSTWVRTNDNLIIIVPNAEFTTGRVTNWTANDRQVRFSFPVGVAYRSNPESVRALLLTIASRHPDVLKDPSPEVLLSSFGDNSINFDLRVWTITQVQTPNRLKSELYFEIAREFAAQGIEIPFPQRDVYIKSFDRPIEEELKS
jgi:small-conductance mechanosensitive channel